MKIGDKVRIKDLGKLDSMFFEIGATGTIKRVLKSLTYNISVENENGKSDRFKAEELEIFVES